MTICVAAICENNSMVVCASDRKLTAGDIEFEPKKSKIVSLTNSIIVMIAGDSSLQEEILKKVKTNVWNRIQSEPLNWWKVSDVAELYVHYYMQAKRKRAETAILMPLGLDSDSFINRQQNMDRELVLKLSKKIILFEMLGVETIFSGVDNNGAHIYTFENQGIQCLDGVGFASIGIGRRLADSEFMFAGHTGSKKLPETSLLVYSAKKRAQAAPGVGEDTDMYFIGPNLGFYYAPKEDEEIFKKLEEFYSNMQNEIKRLNQDANKATHEYFKQLMETAPALQKVPTKESGGDIKPEEKNPISQND